MIIEYHGNVFNSKAKFICHQVNCQSKMGRGIALTIHKKYPKVFDEYYNFCEAHSKDRSEMLGHAQFVKISDDRTIVNLYGQLYYGTDRMQTSYKALRKALIVVRDKAIITGDSVAIPYLIGCDLAGGNWNVVSAILNALFGGKDDPTLEIWNNH